MSEVDAVPFRLADAGLPLENSTAWRAPNLFGNSSNLVNDVIA